MGPLPPVLPPISNPGLRCFLGFQRIAFYSFIHDALSIIHPSFIHPAPIQHPFLYHPSTQHPLITHPPPSNTHLCTVHHPGVYHPSPTHSPIVCLSATQSSILPVHSHIRPFNKPMTQVCSQLYDSHLKSTHFPGKLMSRKLTSTRSSAFFLCPFPSGSGHLSGFTFYPLSYHNPETQ